MAGNAADRGLHCSFCGKGDEEVRKLIAGPAVFICDECIDLCNDIIEEESLPPDGSLIADTEETSGGEYLSKPQIVTRYCKEKVTVVSPSDFRGEYWVCDGCGWRLKLVPGAIPPCEHSEEIVLGLWPDDPAKVSVARTGA